MVDARCNLFYSWYMKTTQRTKSIFAWIFTVVAMAGLLDAVYLSVKHYTGNFGCSVTAGCEVVTTSEYATILGIPLSVLGVAYYGTQLILSLIYIAKRNDAVMRLAGWFTVAGLLASSFFVYLQLFVIDAICFYCMISAGTSTLLFIIGMINVRIFRDPNKRPVTEMGNEEEE